MTSVPTGRSPQFGGVNGVDPISVLTDLTSTSYGKAVTMSGTKAILTTDNSSVLGRLERVERETGETTGVATVTPLGGGPILPYTVGATPTVGTGIKGGSTAGTVKTANVDSRGYILAIDGTNKTVKVII